jgi:hypothetical protein
MKHFKTLFKLLSILIVFTITFTACNEDDELKPGETPQQAANRICPVGEGFELEDFNNNSFFNSGETSCSLRGNSDSKYVIADFRFNNVIPQCDVLQFGVLYTTDGSEPSFENSKTFQIIKKGDPNSSFVSNNFSNVFFAHIGIFNGYSLYISNDIPNQVGTKGVDVNYITDLEAYNYTINSEGLQTINSNIPDYFTLDVGNDGYKTFIITLDQNTNPEISNLLASNVKYRGFMKSLKDNDIFLTPVAQGQGPPPTSARCIVENTSDNLIKNIKGEITNKKAVNGLMYTDNNTDFLDFFQNGNHTNWTKVFVQDSELTVNPNDSFIHSFSKNITAENNKLYTVVTFTSDDTNLIAASTKYSTASGFSTSAGQPIADVSATTTNNSITLTGNIQSNGNTAVTAYGLKLFSDASYTTVIAENNQTGSATGPFTLTKDALNPNTTYYAEVYATNSVGTGNKRIEVITNAVLPTLTIANPTSPDAFSSKAQFNAQITNNGNALGSVTNYGFELTNPNTTVTQINQAETSGNLSNFSRLQENLTVGNYSVRAFAINSAGTAYSESKPFTISATVVLPTVTIDQPTTNVNDVTLVGHVTNNGNGTITNFTFEIFDEFDQEIPVIQSNVTGNAATFTYTFDSMGVDNIKVRAKANNSAGTGVSDEIFYSVF